MTYTVAFRFRGNEYFTELEEKQSITFGSHKKDDIQVPDSGDHILKLRITDGVVRATTRSPLVSGRRTITLNEINSIAKEFDSTIYVSRISGKSLKYVNLPYTGTILVGRSSSAELKVSFPIVSSKHFRLNCEAGKVHAEDLNSTNGTFLNGKKLTKALLKAGDVLSIYTFRFVYREGKLFFENIGSGVEIDEGKIRNQQEMPDAVPVLGGQKTLVRAELDVDPSKYLNYHLSPRTREQLPSEPIVLSDAPGAMKGSRGRMNNWAYLMGSVAMMAASMSTGMMNPMMVLARSAYMISPIANMAMYGKMNKEEKKQLEEYEVMRQERYRDYVADQKARIAKVADIQRRIVLDENPEAIKCLDTVHYVHRSLWERMPSDNDFLALRLGIGKQKLCVEVKSHNDNEAFTMEDDELKELAAQIIEETRYVEDIPVLMPLQQFQTVGIFGSKDNIVYQLRSLLVEMASEHSFQDVRIIGLFEDKQQKYWGVLRWLPHIWDESGQVRYIAFDKERRHTVCEFISDIVRQREHAGDETIKEKDKPKLPHYIILVENRELLLAETVYEKLVSNNPSLGITTVFMADSIYNLPQTCQYLVDLTGTPTAFERDKFDERSVYQMDEKVHQPQMDAFGRKLAAIELENKAMTSAIPSALTFLQGYRVETVEELNIAERWEHSEPFRTLAAPIGRMEGGEEFYLDVRSGETSHGPHGLLAGTTGSGKSELLQSWILSMAVNYHPHDVNFVIIDYKGGGMSDLMEPLPHVVGKITNIDRNILRSLISLKSELQRRQRLFAQAGVNNIDKYQKAYKNGEVKEQLPHLIIVTDEFAELKKEEPEFLAELNSVATVGRSLGIHMLLATQRPAGVVTDQIDSNSRFRICMKVQDVLDSREMLKRSDAARITQPGRAYIRVGEDEIFELFQSYYSAADYFGDQPVGMDYENQVRIIGVTGNRIGNVTKKKRKSDVDELTAVTQHINDICAQLCIEKLSGPWLPELPRVLTFDDLDYPAGFDGEKWPESKNGLAIPIGKYDIPSLQTQGVQMMDFMETGHFGAYGMPSSGKTTFLKGVLLALGMYYTPEDVQITVMDAGNWSLSEFAGMPHVQEVILNQDESKIAKFSMRITKELENRKRVFLNNAVNSLKAYREATGTHLPAFVIVINHLELFFEQYDQLEELMTEIASTGAQYGIYLVFTSNSTIGIRYQFLQLIKGAIAFQLPDIGDYASLVGRTVDVSLPQFPGRALTRGNPPVSFQNVMYIEEQDDKLRSEELKEILDNMSKAWGTAPRMEHVEVKPEPYFVSNMESVSSDIPQEPDLFDNSRPNGAYTDRTHFPIGSDTVMLDPVVIDFSDTNMILVSSNSRNKNQVVIDHIADMLESRQDNSVIRLNQENCKSVLDDLLPKLQERKKNYNKLKREGTFDADVWLSGYLQVCLIIEDLPEFCSFLTEEVTKGYRRVFAKTAELGIVIVAGGERSELEKGENDMLINTAVQTSAVLALEGLPAEYGFVPCEADPTAMGDLLDDDEAVLFRHGGLRVIRL